MKKFVFVVAVFAGLNCFAQSNSVSMKAPSMESPLKGVYIGLDYTNYTDLHSDFSMWNKYGSRESYNEVGTSLGIAGIRLGYSQVPEFGFGFLGGARMGESFVRSEYGDNKLRIAIAEANAAFAVNSLLYVFAGANYSSLFGGSEVNSYKGDFGFQAGAGARFNQNISLIAGYTLIQQTIEENYSQTNAKARTSLAGFNSSLNYTF